jgi:alkylation response protein AidB-like acyl-CoA dehydrogenase
MTTVEELRARAEKLVPNVAARAREAEELRRVPDATIAEFTAADFWRALTPRRFGGLELPFPVVPQVGQEIGRGCISSAWVLTFLMMHGWLLAMFCEETQAEVFGKRGYGLAPGALSPTGRAVPVEGGYRLSGRWSWATGVMHSDWVLVTGIPEGEMPRMMLLPIGDVQVDDVWHTDGMRATGSNDIVARDVFVPERRTISFAELAEGRTPGAALHEGSLYRIPLVPMLCFTAASPALGGAHAALHHFDERMRSRVLAYSRGEAQKDAPSARIRLGRATARLRAATALFEETVGGLDETYRSGASFSRQERAACRLASAHVVAECKGIVNELCDGAGASIHHLDSPLNRIQRDLNTLSGHAVFDYDRAADLYSRVLLDVDVEPTDLL